MIELAILIALGAILGGLWTYAIWARSVEHEVDRVEDAQDHSGWLRKLHGGGS